MIERREYPCLAIIPTHRDAATLSRPKPEHCLSDLVVLICAFMVTFRGEFYLFARNWLRPASAQRGSD
jgi:hypothetical protein